MDLYSLPDELQRQVEEELEPGETIRWLGQPQPRGFPRAALFPLLFGGFWTTFSLIFVLAGILAPAQQGPGMGQLDRVMFVLVGGFFILIGISMLSSFWWIRRSLRRRAQQSAYAITDRRAIVFDGGYAGAESSYLESMMFFGGFPFFTLRNELRIRTFLPKDLTSVERVQRQDGSGDVMIQRGRGASWFPFPGMTADPPAGFFSVPNVRDVERQLRELRATADAPSA